MEAPAITVIGSANTDMVVRVPDLPGPGETVLGGEFVSAGGGKGANQAIAARRLGAEVTFVARLGQDGLGDAAIADYQGEGIDTTHVVRDPGAPSGVALIMVGKDGENMIAVAPGANSRLTAADVHRARATIAGSRVLVAQLEVPLDAVLAGLRLGRQAGALTILNPAPAPSAPLPDEVYPLVDILNPNRSEAEALTGIQVTDNASAERAAQALLERGVGTVVVTLGSQGAMVVTANHSQSVPAHRVQSVDTTGAGDAFTAGLAVALARGSSPVKAARYAAAVGALATTRVGAQPSLPTAEEVREFISKQST